MSPTEDQLRRALREGEGDGPDPTGVIVRASAYRRERRTKILSAVAVVALVAGIGAGVGVLATDSNDSRSSADSAGGGMNAGSADQAGGSAQSEKAVSSGGAQVPVYPSGYRPCPDRLPSIQNGPSSRPASSDTEFFTSTTTASTVTICGYLGTGVVVRDATSTPLVHVFSGNDATTITASINATSAEAPGAGCGAIPAAEVHSLLVLTRYTSGAAAMPVRIGLGCDTSLTNGRTIRYQWDAPPVLQPFLDSLQSAAASGGSVVPGPTTS